MSLQENDKLANIHQIDLPPERTNFRFYGAGSDRQRGPWVLPTVSKLLRQQVVTRVIRFRVPAEDWQRVGRVFTGLIFAHQRRVSFGEMVSDLELIAQATDSAFWLNRVEQLPL